MQCTLMLVDKNNSIFHIIILVNKSALHFKLPYNA